MDLTKSKRTWFTYIGMHHFKQLTLEHCPGTDTFLTCLSAGAATPRIRNMTIVHQVPPGGDRTLHALQDLLTLRTHCLCSLKLCIRNASGLLSTASLRAHRNILKILLLDITGTKAMTEEEVHGWGTPTPPQEGLVYGKADLDVLVRSYKALRQLGVALPSVKLEYATLRADSGAFAERVVS